MSDARPKFTEPLRVSAGETVDAHNVRWLLFPDRTINRDGGKVSFDPAFAADSARVYNSAAITLTTATETLLTFNSERFDTNGLHSPSSNPGRLTAPSSGVYLISAHLTFASNATGIRYAYIRLNGSTIIARAKLPTSGSGGLDDWLSISTICWLAAGDYVEVFAFQNSGGNLNILSAGNSSPEFAMTRVVGVEDLFSPLNIPGLVLWLKADAIIGLADGDAIGTWPDSSGQGNNATQATASKKPTYKTGIINGNPVVRLDGTDDELRTPFLMLTNMTVFVVMLSEDLATGHYLLAFEGGLESNAIITGFTSGLVETFSVPRISAGAFSTSDFSLHVLRRDVAGGSTATFKNGSQVATSGIVEAASTGALWIGIRNGFPSSEFFDGDIAEILVYNSALSTRDREAVEGYLNAKYDLY